MNDVAPDAARPKHIFISYSRVDAAFRAALQKHLSGLVQTGAARVWADDRIEGGEQWSEVLEREIARADIALLLVSSDFIASTFIRDKELPALRAREPGLRIVPVLVREIDWPSVVLSSYQALRGAKAIATPDNDPAWTEVVEQLRRQCFASQHGEQEQPAASRAAAEERRTASRPRALWLWALLVALAVVAAAFVVWWHRAREQALSVELQRVERALDLGDRTDARKRLERLEHGWQDRPEVTRGLRVVALFPDDKDWDPQRFEDEVAALRGRSGEHGRLFEGHVLAAHAGKLLYDGELDAARGEYQQALKARPGLVEAQLGLGVIALWRNELDAAIAHFESARSAAPQSTPVLDALAWAHASKGNAQRARELYEHALRRDADYLPPYLELARLQRGTGDVAASLATLRRAEQRFDQVIALPKNVPPLSYRVSPRTAKDAQLHEPPLILLTDALRKRYYYRLSMALSACLTGDGAQQSDSLQQARALVAAGLSRDGAQRAWLLLRDELSERNDACLTQIAAGASMD